MEDELNRNTAIIDILRNAIDNKDIYIQYQPHFELETNTIIGFEALMRIRSDNLGFLTLMNLYRLQKKVANHRPKYLVD